MSTAAPSADSVVPGLYSIDLPGFLGYPAAAAHFRSVEGCQSFRVRVEAGLRQAEVVFDDCELDLGLLAVNKAVTKTVTIRNVCNAEAQWSLATAPWDTIFSKSSKEYRQGRRWNLDVEPSCGTLPPFGTAQVSIHCMGGPKPVRIRDMLQCVVAGGASVGPAIVRDHDRHRPF